MYPNWVTNMFIISCILARHLWPCMVNNILSFKQTLSSPGSTSAQGTRTVVVPNTRKRKCPSRSVTCLFPFLLSIKIYSHKYLLHIHYVSDWYYLPSARPIILNELGYLWTPNTVHRFSVYMCSCFFLGRRYIVLISFSEDCAIKKGRTTYLEK